MGKDLSEQRAPDSTLRNFVKFSPQAAAAYQEQFFDRDIRPRHAKDPLLAPAASAGVDQFMAYSAGKS